MSLEHCHLIDLPRVPDARGNLTFIEGGRHVPFQIARAYYLYDVPGGAVRGGHAHRRLEQLIVAVTGSFDVLLDDGRNQRTHALRVSNQGLFVSTMVWRELSNFTSGAICLSLASRPYEEDDYIRDHALFLREAGRSHAP
jgi:dTDP-4-dehydrorhamnose 3,5-epimerase-like enzyme